MRCVVAVLICLGVGCEAEGPASDFAVRRVQDFEAPEEEGNLTAAEKARNDELRDMLIAEHGQRPRRYNGLFNGSNEAERCFAGSLADFTNYVNERLAARGFDERLDQAMVASNFVTEGGYFVLKDNRMSGIDGFGSLGIDTLVDNYRALKPYLHPQVQTGVEAGDRTSTYTNERGEEVQSMNGLRIDEGARANAGMFAWAMAQAAQDMNNPAGLRSYCTRKGKTPNAGITATNMADLPAWKRYFWATVYFNAGPGTGKKLLCQHWLPYADRRLTGDHSNTNPLYNALWRTSTYRYMAGTIGDDFGAYCQSRRGSACACDPCAYNGSCYSCVEAEGCGWCAARYACTGANERACGMYFTDSVACDNSGWEPSRPCGDAIGCADCIAAGCGWCGATSTCMDGGNSGPFTGGCGSGWSKSSCPEGTPCFQSTCGDCVAEEGCGWCSQTSGCGAGGADGPTAGSCTTEMGGEWFTTADGCGAPAAMECPAGQYWDWAAAEPGCVANTPECAAPTSCGDCVAVATGCEWCWSGPSGAHCSKYCTNNFASDADGCASHTCQNEGSYCSTPGECCEGLTCLGNTCSDCSGATTVSPGATCDVADMNACCGTMACAGKSSPTDSQCCFQDGFTCAGSNDCCGTMQCIGGSCRCRIAGEPCVNGLDCCGGILCVDGTCGG